MTEIRCWAAMVFALMRRERGALRWCGEVVGVLAIAAGAWMIAPAAGLVIVGAYCIIVANSGGS